LKSLTLLWQTVASDLGNLCGASTARDYKTVVSRVENEGLSFLTITLAQFAKDLEKGLEQNRVDRHLFTGFQRKGELPLFLGGFLDRIFDRANGVLLQDPSSDAIYAIRQLTLMFAKINLPCSDARTEAAITGFLKCEQELKQFDSEYSGSSNSLDFRRISFLLFRSVLGRLEKDVWEDSIIPKHGPGATADKLKGNRKFVQKEWPLRLEEHFPYVDYALPNHRYHQMVDRVQFLEPGAERPVRVITVPKTLKTPRIIAIEPTAMQYMQQALLEQFVSYLESDKSGSIQGMLGYTDQVPNQNLACEGSRGGTLATLDLSEASDRVSNQLVLDMFHYFPLLSGAVQACRSRKADVNGKTIRLSKFASMGSALCFPIESMVFLTVIFAGIEKDLGHRLTLRDVESLRGQVRVYGDDIIVPVRHVTSVNEALRTFGFKVNLAKSFWNGRFRESCGKDYYGGDDVSIVRCRSLIPSSRADVSEIVSTISLRNQMFTSGCWETAKHLDGLLTNLLGHFPAVGVNSPVLGRTSFLGYDNQKEHRDLFIPLVKGYRVTSTPPASRVDGVDALMKWFLKRGPNPFDDKDHLERTGRPNALHIKLGWYSAV